MALTDFKVKLPRGARSKYVRKAFEDEQVAENWSKTAWAKRIARFERRETLTDFDRFKIKHLKQRVMLFIVYFYLIIVSGYLEISSDQAGVQQTQESNITCGHVCFK